ncbi:hypothetical protein HDF19_06145 [Mucilaginibacter sp. E4BP6]|uniref:hypothetical protein n=1 Tax=Mucilaginibacter sp. E4BP6 TaxID=2723089 RepID=UPI003B00C36E
MDKKIFFSNKNFYIFLLCLIIGLLIYNVFSLITTSNLYAIIPISIEMVLLYLIVAKNRSVRFVVIIWAIIALIIGYGFEFIADLMDDFNNHFSSLELWPLILNLIGLAIGIIVIDYTRRTVLVVSADENPTENIRNVE